MQKFHQILPRLDLLAAFEAAARHESFTLAAGEMNVTQSAVSQRIRALEDRMGIKLFERRHRSVRLTREGRDFQNSVTLALNHLVAASDAVKATAAETRLCIATDVALAHFWLMPRFEALAATLPGVTVDLTASDAIADSFSPSIDAAIVHGDGDWPGFHATRMFDEVVFPVCSPGYLDQAGPFDDPGSLASADLIDLAYERWAWMNWAIWLTETGAPRTGMKRVFQSNSYAAVIDAARAGLGFALGWRGFLDDDLASDRLVAPLDETVSTPNGYYFICPNDRMDSIPVKTFRDWCVEASGQAPIPNPLAQSSVAAVSGPGRYSQPTQPSYPRPSSNLKT